MIEFKAYPRGPLLVVFFSIISSLCYLIFKLSPFPYKGVYFETFFILAFLIGIFFRPWQYKKDMGIILIVIGISLPLIFFFINYFIEKNLAIEYFHEEKLVKLTAFVAVGYWIGGTLRNIYFFLVFAFLGLIIALFNVDVIPEFEKLFLGQRVDFGIQNAQHTAMFFGLAVIAFLSFFQDLLRVKFTEKNKKALFLIYLFTFLLALTVFIGAQTRAAILAMDFIFLISIIHFLIHCFKKKCDIRRNKLLIVYFLLFSTFLLVATNKIVLKRGIESEVRSELAKGELTAIPMTSLGVRVNSWIEASKWIKQKPLQGWGGNVRTSVMQQSNFSESFKSNFGHFHNSYVEFTVSYGLIGLGFIIFIFYWVNRRIYSLYVVNSEYKGVWLFTLYGTLFLLLINVFESYLFFRTGVFATSILLAPAYTLHLANLYSRVTK